ncbi:hypothetical protein CEXT_235151 [Caerostris extrusa]|uniref:Uncharacterized protein n=1 Tax=Caerostris extrusa TaxID=172846 RepID=A0AAV4VG67_CAEEX|nr:hypothetical protein CEXT_235151 [Caerostris extrusa]
MGANQREGYNNEKERKEKSLFLWAFAREMKIRLNPHTAASFLRLLPPGPLITTQTADHTIPSDFPSR